MILKISFDAKEVIYINKISIPPKKIKNKEYENQKLILNDPVIKEIIKVWIIKINPIDKGWFINKNENLNNIIVSNKKKCIIFRIILIYFIFSDI